jgi:asparaginyl-tRNA synthetase
LVGMSLQSISIKHAFGLAVGSEITLRGWVRSRRDSKGITFIELNDGSRFKSMQLVVDSGIVPDEVLKQVTTGSSIAASGIMVESPAKGQAVELKVAGIQVYGGADPAAYPLQKKGHSLEFLREISHLRVRSNTFGAAFRDIRLRRRRPDVRRHDLEPATAATRAGRASGLAAGLFW